MEFFKIIEVRTSEKEIWEKIDIQHLEDYCSSLFPLEEGKSECLVGGIWGEFRLRRDEIKGGVRFSLLDCPNALAWTVTTGYPPARDHIVVHITINRERKPEEFIDEIHQFIDDLDMGLKKILSK